jgi:hypothetical protein
VAYDRPQVKRVKNEEVIPCHLLNGSLISYRHNGLRCVVRYRNGARTAREDWNSL